MERSESIVNLSKALVKAQSEMGAVSKGAVNPYYNSKFADINEVIKTVKEVLNNNQISFLQPLKVIDVAGEKVSVIETILIHESGEYISSQIEVVSKDKNDPQKFGLSITYSRRFGLQSMLGLPAEDDDGNKASDKSTDTKGKGFSRKTKEAPAPEEKPTEPESSEPSPETTDVPRGRSFRRGRQ